MWKIGGGCVALGTSLYEVYGNYEVFGASKEFLMASGADITRTGVIIIGGGFATSAGVPLIAVAIGGGAVIYLVNTNIISPFKESLKK